jgi:DNA-binding XRE family transcriptional regulator
MIPAEELHQMYHNEKMTQKEIGNEIGVSDVTVSIWMKEYGIETHAIILSKSELECMYLNKKMSQMEIAKEIGVSQKTVNRQMEKYGIKSRTCSESQMTYTLMPSKTELGEMYIDKEMSMAEIGREIGVFPLTVNTWMKKYGIKSRTLSETHSGEKNSSWKGGISFEPYCSKFNKRFKESIRDRDDYTCQLCGCEQLLGGRKLDVHHIHYDKENCAPDVVALCRSCNINVNGNRDYWEQYFESQLLERGLLNLNIPRDA